LEFSNPAGRLEAKTPAIGSPAFSIAIVELRDQRKK